MSGRRSGPTLGKCERIANCHDSAVQIPGFLGGQADPDQPTVNGYGVGGFAAALLGALLWLVQGGIWPGGVLAGLGAALGQLAISQIDARKQRGRILATFAVGIGAGVAIFSVAFSFM